MPCARFLLYRTPAYQQKRTPTLQQDKSCGLGLRLNRKNKLNIIYIIIDKWAVR